MFFMLSRVYSQEQACVIEAESFEEAKKKVTEDDWYWCDQCLDYEGYRMGEDEEEIYGEDYVQLDDIEF